MSAGMAYEAMNNAHSAGNRLIVILNDNDMSIAPPVGALSAYLARLISSGTFISVREGLRKIARRMPRPLHIAARKADEFRSEEHTSELQSLMRISYAVFCLKKKTKPIKT